MLRNIGRTFLPAACRLAVNSTAPSNAPHRQIYRSFHTGGRLLARFGKRPVEPSTSQNTFTWGKFAHATAFTVVGAGSFFAGCVIWEYEEVRAVMRRHMERGPLWARRPFEPGDKWGEWRAQLSLWWASQTEGQKVFWPICFVNVLVFGAWKIPSLAPTMLRYFASSPASRGFRLPMLLSGFSHYSFIHLAVNMFVLHSFSTSAVILLGKEQFLGLYLSGALTSSLASYLYKMFVFSPAVSLGASGAIMAILGYVCTESPDSRLAIVLLPMLTFTAGTAIKALVAFDVLGAALRWQLFDHAAHLGGTLFGIYWAMHGRQHIWEKREPLIRWYHNLREAGKRR
ncbi:presenilins-associated rhomboid-like protein, mitochondrial [Amphibalanus amphitrite]|uniref:presenilins-associated rhomboid-like protein, mitochondrial n=1 Tax=Amphibalanus amphitrite TaxID=1232801 RepID=UPI001C9064D9|nr:presenilins-associated rhomboid-like protein, mitochondrial [Amphibalanus amphitrite]